MRIRWTEQAAGDLRQAYDHIAKDNKSSAKDETRRIAQAIGNLKTNPKMGRVGRVKGTFELVVHATPYIVAYRIKAEAIELLAVLHGKRRWPKRFK